LSITPSFDLIINTLQSTYDFFVPPSEPAAAEDLAFGDSFFFDLAVVFIAPSSFVFRARGAFAGFLDDFEVDFA
jgi:hypothetical protein